MNTKEYATYTVKLVIKPVQLPVNNRADPENVNFETFVLRILNFTHLVTSTQIRNAENFNLISQIVYEL